MRWRLESILGYTFTHTLRLTNAQGTPLYDMIFATDHVVGNKIMQSVYAAAAARFPSMRREARARWRDRQDRRAGTDGLFSHEELLHDAPLSKSEAYEHIATTVPYGHSGEYRRS